MDLPIVRVEDFCQLVPRYGGGIAPIEVKESEPVLIGRGSTTAITDERCQESQVSMNESTKSVECGVFAC